MRIARLNFAAGTTRAGLAAGVSLKSNRRRKSAVQLAARRGRPPSWPLLAVNSKRYSRIPAPLSNATFQLYASRIIECPSRNAATENSIGIVGTSVAGRPPRTAFLPWLKTLLTTPGAQMRGR